MVINHLFELFLPCLLFLLSDALFLAVPISPSRSNSADFEGDNGDDYRSDGDASDF